MKKKYSSQASLAAAIMGASRSPKKIKAVNKNLQKATAAFVENCKKRRENKRKLEN